MAGCKPALAIPKEQDIQHFTTAEWVDLVRGLVDGAPPESEAPGLAAGHERNPDRPDARAVEAAQPRDAVLPLDCPHPPGDERLEVVGRGREHEPAIRWFRRAPHVSRSVVGRGFERVIPDG